MTVSRIWKEHAPRGGDKVGTSEIFEVEPRKRDGKFLVKKAGATGNRDEVYDKIDTLDEVWALLQSGRSVRMKGQTSKAWNTLNGEGAKYA
jgi:hypothetical protein